MLSDIVIILLLILFKGVVTACSSSLSVMEIRRGKYTSDKDDPNYDKLNKLVDNSRRYTHTAGIVNAFLGLLIGFVLAFGVYGDVRDKLLTYGFFAAMNGKFVAVLCAAAVILVFTYLFALLSIIIPKGLAQKFPDKIVLRTIWLMNILNVVFRPFIWLIDLVVDVFNLVADKSEEYDEKDVSENEIRMMVDAGREEGSIDEDEKEMIKNIFEFDDKNVEEIATHRKEIFAVPIDISLDELTQVIIEGNCTRIPVYEEDIDNIIGILHIRDFMTAVLGKGRDSFNLRDIIMEPYFVPSTKKADSLFEEMQHKNVHMAIVVDEYGGTAGLVTMEDLIEEVMGEIHDEYDEDEIPEITEITESVVRIEGSTALSDVAERLGIEMPEEDFDTLGGFLIGQLDRIPDEDETDISVEYEGYIFRIDEIEDNRIAMVTVIKQQA